MRRTMLKSKIQKVEVTFADLDYEGSLGLDEDLLKAADMIPYEKVHVYNVSNGERFSTYLIKEEAGSGKAAIYGAAAHKAGRGDRLILVTFVQMDDEETEYFVPKVVILGAGNAIKDIR